MRCGIRNTPREASCSLLHILCLLVLVLFFSPARELQAHQEGRRSRRDEERKAERLAEASQRLARLSSRADLNVENRFLHEQVSLLVERSRQSPAGSHLLDRLESAIDDLLDASEDIVDARGDREESDADAAETNRRTARDLERTYFRLMQGDYFARQSQEDNAGEYVLTARRLYQQARVAYDNADYRGARRLAEAAREVISGLESLAQAAVPVPEPPALLPGSPED